jgi:hypothetical protein|tara:strand:+ start:364 stop:855 length:492 start_codon:yes stop_codon:yes gene_type:complete
MAQGLMCLIWNGESSGNARRWAIKALSIAHQIGKSPIQQAIPSTDPILIDLNMVRPTITISLLLDKIVTGQTVTGPSKGGATVYKVPTKQDMEDFTTDSSYDSASTLQLMLVHEDNTYETYDVATQQFTSNLTPAKEDRYDCTMVLLAKKRNDAGGFVQDSYA